MAQKHRFNNKRQRPRGRTDATPREAPLVLEKKPPVQYGKPFTLLEDENKNTFEYKAGQWVPHPLSIAEYRLSGRVSGLPQKVKEMTRYEVRCALPASE